MAKKSTKSWMHEQNCCFANLNLLLFWASHCRRHQHSHCFWFAAILSCSWTWTLFDFPQNTNNNKTRQLHKSKWKWRGSPKRNRSVYFIPLSSSLYFHFLSVWKVLLNALHWAHGSGAQIATGWEHYLTYSLCTDTPSPQKNSGRETSVLHQR